MNDVSYASGKTPPDYKCGKCGATGCKLWRPSHTFAPVLACCDCAAAITGESVSGIDAKGKSESKHGRTDQIGGYVPAVPDEECAGYWGYTSVPPEACAWWWALPTRAEVSP